MNHNLVSNWIGVVSWLAFLAGCSQGVATRTTRRAGMIKGAGIGALSGAVLSIAMNKRKTNQILSATAIGAGIGARVGVYMDAAKEGA